LGAAIVSFVERSVTEGFPSMVSIEYPSRQYAAVTAHLASVNSSGHMDPGDREDIRVMVPARVCDILDIPQAHRTAATQFIGFIVSRAIIMASMAGEPNRGQYLVGAAHVGHVAVLDAVCIKYLGIVVSQGVESVQAARMESARIPAKEQLHGMWSMLSGIGIVNLMGLPVPRMDVHGGNASLLEGYTRLTAIMTGHSPVGHAAALSLLQATGFVEKSAAVLQLPEPDAEEEGEGEGEGNLLVMQLP
jgi:hypothetical protein